MERLGKTGTVDKVSFGFMPEKGTMDVVFVLGKLQEEYYAKGCICIYMYL